MVASHRAPSGADTGSPGAVRRHRSPSDMVREMAHDRTDQTDPLPPGFREPTDGRTTDGADHNNRRTEASQPTHQRMPTHLDTADNDIRTATEPAGPSTCAPTEADRTERRQTSQTYDMRLSWEDNWRRLLSTTTATEWIFVLPSILQTYIGTGELSEDDAETVRTVNRYIDAARSTDLRSMLAREGRGSAHRLRHVVAEASGEDLLRWGRSLPHDRMVTITTRLVEGLRPLQDAALRQPQRRRPPAERRAAQQDAHDYVTQLEAQLRPSDAPHAHESQRRTTWRGKVFGKQMEK